MRKLDGLYKLMMDYKQILEITASRKDMKLLNEFIKLLDKYKAESYDEFFKNLVTQLEPTSLKPKTQNVVKNKKYDLSKIVPIYKNYINNKTLVSRADAELLEGFNCKYPNIKNIIVLENSVLYSTIHSIPLKSFTLIELKFLLIFYFNTKVSSKSTKKDLYDQLLNNIYQSNYLDSLNINYSNINKNLNNIK